MKRAFDLIVSLIFCIIFIPLWILVGLFIKIESPGPIFFRQIRVGRNKKIFNIFKFRTMIVDAEKKGLSLTIGGHDSRITRLGYLLRKTKIDELPQLFNVFLGEMSFVGPRPEVPKYVKLYTRTQAEVLRVRPGITDIASIKYIDENELLGRASDPEKVYIEKIMPDKISLNLEYLSGSNILSDIKIIFYTIFKILK